MTRMQTTATMSLPSSFSIAVAMESVVIVVVSEKGRLCECHLMKKYPDMYQVSGALAEGERKA